MLAGIDKKSTDYSCGLSEECNKRSPLLISHFSYCFSATFQTASILSPFCVRQPLWLRRACLPVSQARDTKQLPSPVHPDGSRKYVNWFINLTVLLPASRADGSVDPDFLEFYQRPIIASGNFR